MVGIHMGWLVYVPFAFFFIFQVSYHMHVLMGLRVKHIQNSR